MISYRKLVLASTLGLSISFAGGFTTEALAGSPAPSSSRVTGTVLRINASTRTMIVRTDGSTATVKVHVPEGAYVALSKRGNTDHYSTSVPFELARRGNHVNVRIAQQEN